MESDDKSLLSSLDSNRIVNLQKMSAENQRQIDVANSLINNSAIQAIVDKFNVDDFAKNHPLADEIENGVKELIKENNKLKETLKSHSTSMKRHYFLLEKWLEEAQSNHKNYKRKLDEATYVIAALKNENSELKKPIEEIIHSIEGKSVGENTKLLHENQILRENLNVSQQKIYKLEQITANVRPEKEQELRQIAHSLSKQLENSERARRKLSLEVERFSSQELKLQLLLSNGDPRNVTNSCFWNAIFPNFQTPPLRDQQLLENLKKYNDILHPDDEAFNELWQNSTTLAVADSNDENRSIEQLKEEIVTLRKTVMQEQAAYVFYQKILENARSKFNIIHHQSVMTLKEYNSRLRAQEIALEKAKIDGDAISSLNHEISDKQNRIIQLESELNLLRKKLDEAQKRSEDFCILQNQIKIYEEDYSTERAARETLTNEKLMLERELNKYKQRCKKDAKLSHILLDDGLNNLADVEPTVNSAQFTCFNETCKKSFASEEELQTHVYSCFDLKD